MSDDEFENSPSEEDDEEVVSFSDIEESSDYQDQLPSSSFSSSSEQPPSSFQSSESEGSSTSHSSQRTLIEDEEKTRGAASVKEIEGAFLQRKNQYQSFYQIGGLSLTGTFLLNLERFYETQNDETVTMKTVRRKRFEGPDLKDALMYQIRRRLIYAFPQTLLLLHVQLSDRAYWFGNNSERDLKKLKTTMLGFYPFRISRYQNTLVFDEEIMRGEAEYRENLFASIKKDVESSTHGFKPTLTVYLINNVVLNTEVLMGFPSENNYLMTVEEANAKYDETQIFLSKGLYESSIFNDIINREIDDNYIPREQRQKSIFQVLYTGFAATNLPAFSESPYFQQFFISAQVPLTKQIAAFLVEGDYAMSTKTPFVRCINQHLRAQTKIYEVRQKSMMTKKALNKGIFHACWILNNFGLGINVLSPYDMDICYEAQIETGFIFETLYGPNTNFLKNIDVYVPLKNDPYVGFTPFVPIHDFSVANFLSYQEANRKRIFAWLIVFKMILKHGFKTPIILALFKDIFQYAHYIYCLSNGIKPETMDVVYDRMKLSEIMFLRLFANPSEIDSHIRYMTDRTDIPFASPQYFHVGYYTVVTLVDFFLASKAMFLETNNIQFVFSGCFATHVTDTAWSIHDHPYTKPSILHALVGSDVFTSTVDTDWGNILESSIRKETIDAAIANTAPIVMFGSRVLQMNELGNACRRLFLSTVSKKFIPSDSLGDETLFFDEVNISRFLNARNPEAVQIARILIAMRHMNETQEDIDKLKERLDHLALLKWYATNPDLPVAEHQRSLLNGVIAIQTSTQKEARQNKGGAFTEYYPMPKIPDPTRPTAKRVTDGIFQKTREERSSLLGRLENAFRKARSGYKTKKIPTPQEEEEFINDVLLVTWFLQSPFFHTNRYESRTTFVDSNGNSTIFGTARSYNYNFQPSVIFLDRKGRSLNESWWPSSIQSLVNISHHALSSVAVPQMGNAVIGNMTFRRKRDKTTGEFSYIPNTNEELFSKRGRLRPHLLENISKPSVILPSFLCVGKNRMENTNASFFWDPRMSLYTATSGGKTIGVSSISIIQLFEGYPLSIGDANANPTSRSLLVEENYFAWSLLKQFIDMFGTILRFKCNQRALGLIRFEMTPWSTMWSSENMRNVINSQVLLDIMKGVYPLNVATYHQRWVTLNSLYDRIYQGVFKTIIDELVADMVYSSLRSKSAPDYTLLENQYHRFTSVSSRAHPRVKYEIPALSVSALVNFWKTLDSSNLQEPAISSGAKLPPAFINWNVVDTFAAHEYLLSQRHGEDLLSPLQVFRLFALFREAELKQKDKKLLLIIDPEDTKSYTLSTETSMSIPESAEAGEFYAPIVGYVTRGNDEISMLQYNARSPAMNHYGVSRRSRTKEILLDADRKIFVIPAYNTGMHPIYDTNARFITHSNEGEYDDTNGRQRLWNPILQSKDHNVVSLRYDIERKEWYLSARFYLLENNVIGFLFGEVSPIEIFTESMDVFDPPATPTDEATARATAFSDYVSGVCENVFDRETLYPTDRFSWFEYTHTKTVNPVSYRNSKFDNKTFTENVNNVVHLHSETETRNITQEVRQETVKSIVGPLAYRESRVICGYEINGVRFSSNVRYVRYTTRPELANAVFKRVDRKKIALFGQKPDLGYWYLVATKYIPQGAEIIALIPRSNEKNNNVVDWRKFLMSGYPALKLPVDVFGNTWNHPIKAVPVHQSILYHEKEMPYTNNYGSSLPVYGVRQIALGNILRLQEMAKQQASQVPTVNHLEYKNPFLQQSEDIYGQDLVRDHDSLFDQIYAFDELYAKKQEYPTNLVLRPPVVPRGLAIVPMPPIVEPPQEQFYTDYGEIEEIQDDEGPQVSQEEESVPLVDDQPMPEPEEVTVPSEEFTVEIESAAETSTIAASSLVALSYTNPEQNFSQTLLEDQEYLFSSTTEPTRGESSFGERFSHRTEDYLRNYAF
jgi:hypothetical protein